MNKDYLFQSDRLGFRFFSDMDSDTFYKINSNKEVMRYFPSVLTWEQSDSLMIKINYHIEKHGFGFYAVDHLQDKKFIGFIGLKNTAFEAEFTPCVEIGWRLDAEYWNQGLATEGAKRCLDLAFNDLGLDEIYSFTSIINKTSERIMQKIGMIKIEEFDHPALGKDHALQAHCLYKITKRS